MIKIIIESDGKDIKIVSSGLSSEAEVVGLLETAKFIVCKKLYSTMVERKPVNEISESGAAGEAEKIKQ